MRPQLPVASYVFILRKHLWLVLGTVVAVLVGGWFYAETRVAVFESRAVVKMQFRSGTEAKGSPGDDRAFISDQVYFIRNDDGLAAKVLEDLTAPPAPPEPTPAEGEIEGAAGKARQEGPPRHDPTLFAGMTPRRIRSLVRVEPIPGTSYYQVTVRGGDARINYAVANAYARVFSEVFAKEQEARVGRDVALLSRKLEAIGTRLEKADEEVATFKTENSNVDFSPAGSALAREVVETQRKFFTTESARLLQLKSQEVAIQETLGAVDLRIEQVEGRGHVLVPAPLEDIESDPRLSERVQALDVVTSNEGVRRAAVQLDALDEEIRKLTKSASGALLAETGDVRERLDRRQEILRARARATEAALLKQASDVVQTERTVKGQGTQVEELDRKLYAEAAARARLELLEKVAAGLRTERESILRAISDAQALRVRSLEGGGIVGVHAYATPGDSVKVAPDLPVIYATTAVLALLLAAVLAYLLEFLDDTVKTREDFDRLVRLPFLGYVPHIKEGGKGGRDLVVALGKTGRPEVEAFRAIRTGVQFSRPDREVRTFLITIAGPGEGKTTISINVASAFTGGKGRVLLVDADLRRARIHSAMGLTNARGLVNVLMGDALLEDVVQRSSVPGLDVLSSGPIPPNPAEVLGSGRMQEFLAGASAVYDRVVVDSPPIVAVTDPTLLANFVDAVFLVVSIGKTSVRTLQRAQEALSSIGATIHGAILNNADSRISGYSGYYGYGYGYGYESKEEGKESGEAPASAPASAPGA